MRTILTIMLLILAFNVICFAQEIDTTEAGDVFVTTPLDEYLDESENTSYFDIEYDYELSFPASDGYFEMTVTVEAKRDLYDVRYQYSKNRSDGTMESSLIQHLGSMAEGDVAENTNSIALWTSEQDFEGWILVEMIINETEDSPARWISERQIFLDLADNNIYNVIGPEQFLGNETIYPEIDCLVNQRPFSGLPSVDSDTPTSYTGTLDYDTYISSGTNGFTKVIQENASINTHLDEHILITVEGTAKYYNMLYSTEIGILGATLVVQQVDNQGHLLEEWEFLNPFRLDPLGSEDFTTFGPLDCQNARNIDGGEITLKFFIKFKHWDIEFKKFVNPANALKVISGDVIVDVTQNTTPTVDLIVTTDDRYARKLCDIWSGIYESWYYVEHLAGSHGEPEPGTVFLFANSYQTSFCDPYTDTIFINTSKSCKSLRNTAAHEFGHLFHDHIAPPGWPRHNKAAHHSMWEKFPTSGLGYWGRNGARRAAFHEGFAHFFANVVVRESPLKESLSVYDDFEYGRAYNPYNPPVPSTTIPHGDRVEGNVGRSLWNLVSGDPQSVFPWTEDYGGYTNCKGFDAIKIPVEYIYDSMNQMRVTYDTKGTPNLYLFQDLIERHINEENNCFYLHKWLLVQAAKRNTCPYSTLAPYRDDLLYDVEITEEIGNSDGSGSEDSGVGGRNKYSIPYNPDIEIFALVINWYYTEPGATSSVQVDPANITDNGYSCYVDIENPGTYYIECEIALDIDFPTIPRIEKTIGYTTEVTNEFANIVGPGQIRIDSPILIYDTVTILPGTEIIFEGNGFLKTVQDGTENGQIIANGEDGNEIIFKESSSASYLNYPRINIRYAGYPTSFTHCHFSNFSNTAISFYRSTGVTINNCEFIDCNVGVRSKNYSTLSSLMMIDSCEFTNSTMGIYNKGDIGISNCVFYKVDKPILGEHVGNISGTTLVSDCDIQHAITAIKISYNGQGFIGNNNISRSEYGIVFRDADRHQSYVWGNNIKTVRRSVWVFDSTVDLKNPNIDMDSGQFGEILGGFNYLSCNGNTGIPIVVVGPYPPIMEGGYNHLQMHPIWNLSMEYIFDPGLIPLPTNHDPIPFNDTWWGGNLPPFNANVYDRDPDEDEEDWRCGIIKSGLNHLDDDPVYDLYAELSGNSRYNGLTVTTDYFGDPESYQDLFDVDPINTNECIQCHTNPIWANVNQIDGNGDPIPAHSAISVYSSTHSQRYHLACNEIQNENYTAAVPYLRANALDDSDVSLCATAINQILGCQLADASIDETTLLTNIYYSNSDKYVRYVAGSALAQLDIHDGNYSDALAYYENYLNSQGLSELDIIRGTVDGAGVFIQAAQDMDETVIDPNLETRLAALTFGLDSPLRPTSLDGYNNMVEELYEDLEPDYTFDKYYLQDPVTWSLPVVELNDDLYILQGGELTINPGTVVVSNGYSIIVENGELIAQGEADAKIRFCGSDPNEVSWEGIVVKGTGSADLEYVQIVDAKYGLNVSEDAHVEIFNFEIENIHNSGILGIGDEKNFPDGNITAADGIITSCVASGVEVYGMPVARFYNIEITDCGLGYKVAQGIPDMRYSTISNNQNAGVEIIDCKGGKFGYNVIENNGTYGVYVYGSAPLLQSNDIMNNTHNGICIINASATLGLSTDATEGNLFYSNGDQNETDALRAEIYLDKGDIEIGNRHNDFIDDSAPYLLWNANNNTMYDGIGNYFHGSVSDLLQATYPPHGIRPLGVDTTPNNDRGLSSVATEGLDYALQLEDEGLFNEAAEEYLSLALAGTVHVAFDGWIRCLEKSGMSFESLMTSVNQYLDHEIYGHDAYWIKLRIQNSFMYFENTILDLDELIAEAETEDEVLRGQLGQLDTYYEMFMSGYIPGENQGEGNIQGGEDGENVGKPGSRGSSTSTVKRGDRFQNMTQEKELSLPLIGENDDIVPESMNDYYLKRQSILAKLVGRKIEGEGEQVALPTEFKLGNAYPNPFNPTVNIPFDMKEKAKVTIAVYNVLGRKVATLINKPVTAGHHSVIWEGVSDTNSRVSSGIYFIKMTTPGYIQTKKVVMLK